MASAFKELLVMPHTVILGEVGLAGEIRSVSQPVLRINEAQKLGFKHCILPKNNCRDPQLKKAGIELIPVASLQEALGLVFNKK